MVAISHRFALAAGTRAAAERLAAKGHRGDAVTLLIELDRAAADPHPRFRRFLAHQIRLVERALGLEPVAIAEAPLRKARAS